MEEVNSIENPQEKTFVEKDILLKIWTKPREIFKFITENSIDKYSTVLLVLAGIARAFDKASQNNTGDTFPLFIIILFCITLGGLLGWVSFYIYGALLSWTGKWLKGQGNTDSIVRMLAHAMIPSIVSLLLLILQMVIIGNGIFQSTFNIFEHGLIATIIFYITLLCEIVLGIWTVVLAVIGLSEVQKLSIGNSILNMILPALVILVPIILIIFLVGLF